MKNTHYQKLLLQKLSFEKKLLLFIFLIVTIVAVIIILYVDLSRKSRQTRDWVAQVERLSSISDSMISNQREVIIDTRSYIITLNEKYLRSAAQHDFSFLAHFNKLRLLTGEHTSLHSQLDSIAQDYKKYRAIRQQSLLVRKQKNFQLKDQLPFVEAADKALSKLDSHFATFYKEENRLLQERRLAFQKNAQEIGNVLKILLLIFIGSIVSAFVIVYRNSVKRNRAEQALRKSESLVRGIIDHAPVLVNVKNRSGEYILANQQMAVVLKTTPEKLTGKTNEDFLPPDVAKYMCQQDKEVTQSGKSIEFDFKLPGVEGQQTYIASKFPLFDEKGEIYAIGSTSVDITPLKKAHEALEKSYQQQQKILNGIQHSLSASSDLLCIINDKAEIVMISDTASQLFGYSPKELMNKRYLDFVAEEDRAKTLLIATQIMAGDAVTDFTNNYRKKDGSTIPILWSATWVEEDKLMYCIARDATEKINTARQLAQSQARLLHAQKIARLGNWDCDLKKNIWYYSDEIYELVGIEKEEGQNIQSLLMQAIHPEDLPMMINARDQALMHNKVINLEHRIIQPAGQVCYMHTKGEIATDHEGRPVWFSGTMQDITQRKQAELQLQKLNEDLRKRADELKASNTELERFAYVASHDLQEPLRMVSSFLNLLNKKHQDYFDETSKKYIHFAVDGAERMKGLIQDLLQYSRLGASADNFISVDLSILIKEVLKLYGNAIEDDKASFEVDPLPVVLGNKTQLFQLFQNMVGNALKYRSDRRPHIQISCSNTDKEWQFAVRDNGIGIDAKYHEKIFVIFQRLHNKDHYGGTGIGLAICKKIVENHGGKIWITSTVGEGTTFYFTLNKQEP